MQGFALRPAVGTCGWLQVAFGWEGPHIKISESVGKTTGYFVLLLFALSVPFWLLGFWEGTLLPAQLPISALQAICPLLAAVILAGLRAGRDGIRELFKRVLCIRLSGFLVWYLLGWLTMPVVMLVSYVVMRLLGRPVSEPKKPGNAARCDRRCSRLHDWRERHGAPSLHFCGVFSRGIHGWGVRRCAMRQRGRSRRAALPSAGGPDSRRTPADGPPVPVNSTWRAEPRRPLCA